MKPKETNNPTIRPWMNPDGSPMNDKELKQASQEWSQETWEEYLKTLETQNSELLLEKKPWKIEEIEIEPLSALYFSLAKLDSHPRLRKILNIALFKLSPIERIVIKQHFWENKKLCEIAKEQKRTRGAISIAKARALKKLRAEISAEALRRTSEKIEFYESIEH